MKGLYWDNETDSVVTSEDLQKSFSLFADEYDSFSDYQSACMWYNNGSLKDLSAHIANLKRDLARFCDCYDDDEKQAITDDIKQLEKLYLET